MWSLIIARLGFSSLQSRHCSKGFLEDRQSADHDGLRSFNGPGPLTFFRKDFPTTLEQLVAEHPSMSRRIPSKRESSARVKFGAACESVRDAVASR